jgi:BirA family biotin operon repressor/biotin-[acetyl-CoA-carboxylase] ligase
MHKILANTIFLGKETINLTDCHSTNEVALSMVRSGTAKEGTVINTPNQTKGKGQRGNQWLSQEGLNLTFSMVFFPTFLSVDNQFILNMAMAIGVQDGLERFVNDIKVKWPNDFFHDGRKLGGMLIENRLKGQFLESSVVGVGININQIDFKVENAVSLSHIFGSKLELHVVLNEILEKVEKQYLLLKSKSFNSIKDKYLSSLFGYGEWETYDDGEIFKGKISGVGNFGHLEMCKQNGQLKRYELKQISWVKKN